MSCVNKKSKEFTDAVKRLDVHPSALEVIAHKYLNNEDRFPTDKEIMSELSGKPFNATMDAFKWYTKNFLHKPIVLGNLREAHSKLKELRDILGENDAVSMYKDSRGNYVLSVGTPKLENLPFVIDNTLIDTLLERVKDTNPYHQIFKRLVDLIGKDNISIRTGLTAENKTIKEGGHPAGYYQDMREIVFYPENMDFLNDYTEKGKESYIFRTVTHELVHQFTVDTLYKNPSLLTKEERVFQRDITSIYDEARKHVEENEAYGMTNVSEFIAEALTNRWFQKKLAEIKSTKGKSLWGKIAEAFRKIFNIQGADISNTLLEDVLSTTEEFMENQERRREEAQLAYEAFLSEAKQGDVLGFESPSLNRVVAQYSNKVNDYTYYMFTIGEGESKRYAVNIPINSKDTLAEAREKVYDILRENGLDTDRYGVSREFKKVGERDVLYVSPKRSKKIDAEIKGTTKSETPRFTEVERYFLNYLYDVRPDLASDVVDGILDIGELMRHEDELGAFAEAVKDAQLSREIEDSYNEELGNKIQGIMQKLYPEIELNFTDEINPEDIKFGIEEYKVLHPEVETLARQMPLEEAMEVLKNSNRKSLEFQVSKGDRKQYERRLTNIRETGVDLETNEFVPTLIKEDIALFKYLDTIQEKKHQNVVFNWYYDGIINIFEDKYKVDRAIELAKKFNLNLKEFSSPMQVINEYGNKEVTGDGSKWFDLYDNNTEHLSNKREEDGVIVYDVTDSEVTAEFISENIISKFFDRSPWCIFQFSNQKIWEGDYYWNSYDALPRKIAFNKDTGKPVAMFATSNKPTWWDINDKPNSSLKAAANSISTQEELKKLGFTPYNTGSYGNYSKGSKVNGDFYIYKIPTWGEIKDNDIKLLTKEHRSGRKLKRITDYSENGKLSVTSHFNEGGSTSKVTIDYDGKVNFEHININDAIEILNNYSYRYTYRGLSNDSISTYISKFLDIYNELLSHISYINLRKLFIQESYKDLHRILNDFDTIFEDSKLLGEFNFEHRPFIRRVAQEIEKGTLNNYLAQTKFKSLAQLKGLVKSILLKDTYKLISRDNNYINQRFNDIRICKNRLNAFYTLLVEYSDGSLNSEELKKKLSSTRNETPNQLEDDLIPFQLDKDRILGVADLDALSVLIDRVHQKQDTLPHEYAHHYINWFRNSDLVQEGIKRFGSEEQLVQAIGEQVVKQKGEAYNWWQKFVHFIMNILNKDQRVLDKLTDSFLKRANLEVDKDISNIENKIQFQIDNHKQLAFFGEEAKDNGASITYTPPGQKTQTYTIKGSHIYNSEGKEVYAKDGKHRNRIFANLAVQQGRAVVVEHKGRKYVVNNKDAIISVATGDKMNWSENNGDRKAIVELAKTKFSSMRSNNPTQPIQFYEGNITPDANTIFVFGSNPEGRHGAGAAKVAVDKFGAKYGQGEGLQGNAYALPTKDLRGRSLYSEDEGKTPVVMYRGYALKEDREAYNIEETIGKTAVDYDDTLKGSLYFTSSKEEAEDYAKSRTDKSPEPPTQENPQGRPINRHYTGDYAKVSKYYISSDAKVEHYKDINDYRKNGTNSNADVIVLDKGTMWSDNKEYIVRNPKVLIYNKMQRSISPEQIIESIKKMYEVARQHPNKKFKVAYRNTDTASLNGYTGLEMIEMFKKAGPIPSNIVFSKEWINTGRITQEDYYMSNLTDKVQWARTAPNSYEVSTQGDRRFSALNAKFKPGTIIDGVDVGGMTIENVYQSVIKKSGKGKAPSTESKLYNPELKTKAEMEDFSYREGYLPLWQEWAKQNSELIEELREKSAGKVLTDKFANTRVSQARALAEILNTTQPTVEYTNHSGGAVGSDSYWGEIGEKYGVTSKHYHAQGSSTPKGNTPVSRENLLEADAHLLKANETLKRKFPTSNEYVNNLLRRNWQQVKNADAIFAVSTIKDNIVEGGTGWAVQMAIDNNKPVYVFDQNTNKWYKYNNGTWVETETPTLTKNFAGIGTRNLNESGKRAIENVYKNTLGELNTQEVKNTLTEETKAKILQFSAEFEGGYNSLIGKVPEFLLSKVEDYIMSEGYVELSETEAQDFLNYAEAAYAEQETVDQEENQIKKENQTYMERSTKIVEQIDNLTSSSIISATEVRHIAEQAVYWISDHITEIQKTPGLAEKTYGEEHKDKDFASMSRADVVNTIGPEKIILMCKEKFSPDNADYESFDTIDKAELIVNNWDAIMMLASDVFTQIEEFSIVLSKDGKVIEVKEDYTDDADNFSSSNMESAVKEAIGNLQEHWQVETRTLDIISTMSKMVKQFLSKCYLLDKNGNNITSEFGINERVNLREATNSINNWTQGALNLEQMIIKLQEKVDSNPWVKQVIDKLSDKSGKETDFQGQFFGIFYKPFQSYSIVIKEDGKYKSFIVNENPALSEAMTQITTQYKIGEHPLFTTNGINKTSFNELKSSFDELTKYNHQGYDLSNTENKNDAAKTLGYISNLFGYYVTPEMVVNNLNKDTFKSMYSALNYIIKALERNLDNATYDPFNFKKDKDSINGNMKAFLKPITDQLEATAVSATYDNGKMYQSYTTPSYTSKLFQKFKQTGQAFDDFIMAEYYVPWFHTGNDIEREWRNAWLRELVNDSKAREIFKHKVQLNFNKHQYMKNMSDMEYTLSAFAEYFSESTSSGKSRVPAWFRMPMQSNKPSSEFIRFYSERGANYKESLTKGFKLIFDQELSRIQTVEMRNLTKEDSRFIKNFDTNGKKFIFLDFMNEFLTGSKKSSELGKLIRQKLDGNKIDEARMNKLVKEEIMQAMNKKAESVVSTWEKQGILEGAKEIENIGTTKEEVRENLINFVWNDTFAAMNILELTITDPAFYANAEDLQKRLAQIHSPGIRGYVEAVDYEGNPVTDGKYRTINLTDFDTFISNIVDNVSIVFDRKIDVAKREGSTEEVKSLEVLKDSLVRPRTYKKDGSIDDAGGAFWNINVADAQAFNCPTSYRKKAFVFGKWSREAENIYKKLREGTYTYSDLKIAFQPLKPFVYSQIIKDAGIDGVPLSTLKVPIQYKNSEYLLIMADALLRGENTGKPNLLRAIYDVMENSHFDENGNYKTNGIDTIQFDSAVKSGPRGKISLNDLIDKSNGEAIAVARMEAAIYETKAVEKKVLNPETGVEETRTIYERTGNYNNNIVNEFLAEDFCLQQEIPEHFKEHEQLHGSQLRYLIISELENFNYLGEPVTYNLEGKQVTAQEFKTEYENIIAENIQESIEDLAEELSLNNIGSIKDRNIALSKILQREILSSPRYGVDLLIACSVDSDGRFRIPLGDPIQSKRVEQLINSIIKNRINKQKIAGGPVVQVSSFGTSKELNIRFKDKKGNILLTKAEYEKNPIKTSTNDVLSYEDYIKENQAGIAYFEAFAPIYCNDLFTKFADSNGVINTQAIEMLEPDLLKMIGYRIPTEDKYSMTPIKIVGFLPREAGDGIMLPYDITLLTGSDFDIDKIYIMRKDYEIKDNKRGRSFMHELLYNELVSSQKSKLKYETKNALNDLVNQFLNDPFNSSSLVNQKVAKGYMTMTKGAYDKMLRLYLQNMYTVDKPTKGRSYRNNKIVDMTYEVLTHETSVDKMLNPGGFDPQKKMGYLVEAYRQPDNKYTWEQLKVMSIDQLKDLINKDKNLSYIDTHIQFYRQNNAAGSLIGIFAVERVAHAVLESGSPDNTSVYKMDIDNVCKITRPFTAAGKEFGGLMPFDMVYDENNQLIGKILGSLVAASADAVKDPVLNLMNINSYTASILTTLIRFGMSFDNAALFLSQSIISDVLAEFNRENITGYKSLSKVVQDRIDKLKQDNNIDETSILNEEELTYEELVEGLKPNAKPKVAYKTLIAFSNFHKMVEAMKMPTFATRFNSMTSAVGPLIIDNLITEHKMGQFSLESNIVDADSNLITIEDILNNHPILGKFADTIGIAKQLFSNMPANSTGFRNILNLVSESPLSRTIYGDRKLLSSLSDFYQSYLAMRGGVINSKDLSYFITEFPKEFMKKEYKEKYSDNALIQAIKYSTSKSGRVTLKVDTTGLDAQQKEKYSSAWIDLYKVDPDLAIKLFKYNFFKGGIGFSPKTFMNLVPTYIKERIPNYVDTFRVLPSVVPEMVLDQFIRNNWDNNKLVPRKKVSLEKLSNGNVKAYKLSEIEALKDVQYFKTKVGDADKLFMQVSENEFKEITPLGNNKEYLEISETTIDSPFSTPSEAKVEVPASEDGKESELGETKVDTDMEDTSGYTISESKLNDLLYQALVIEGKRTKKEAETYIEKFKTKTEEEKAKLERATKNFLRNRFNILGIKFNEELIDRVYKKLC